MSSTLAVSYDLKLPDGTPSTSLDPSKALSFSVEKQGDLKQYYTGVRVAIELAKNAIGEELTVWRDAVGNREATKEVKAPMKDDDEDDEEEEEEEEA